MKRVAPALACLCLIALFRPSLAQDGGAPRADAPPVQAPAPAAADAAPPDASAPAPLGAPVSVVFQVNDSLVKDKVIAGAQVEVRAGPDAAPLATGATGADGKLSLRVPEGTLFVTYRKPGYVPLERSPTEIRGEGQVVTTTLTMLLESTGQSGQKRIQIVLNWGSSSSQVKDADSHLVCACGEDHVYFGDRFHESDAPKHSANLDVDDMDWGGPETITVLEPIPGNYVYWVHNYSGSPALGASDVVVRVILDDVMAGEFPIPKDWTEPDWRPFKSIAVGADKTARIEPFSPEELQARAPAMVPSDPPSDEGCDGSWLGWGLVLVCIVVWLAGIFLKKR